MGTRDLPNMYALSPVALGLWAYISGKSLVLMLQLSNIPQCKLLNTVWTLRSINSLGFYNYTVHTFPIPGEYTTICG